MAIPYELGLIAKMDTFLVRVDYFMQKAAIAVQAELLTTLGHTERAAYADLVVEGSASIYQHALAALTNSTVAAAGDLAVTVDGGFGIEDSDLEFAVNEMWNAMSKYESGV